MLYSRIFAGVGIVGALAASVVAMTGDGGGGGGGGSNCLANQYPVYNDQGQLTGACNRCPQYATAAAGSYTCSCPASNPAVTVNVNGQVTRCACPDGSSYSTTARTCVCDPNNYISAGTNPDGSLRGCFPKCPANNYPVLDSNRQATGICTRCPPDGTSNVGSFSCTCPTGYRSLTNAFGQVATCVCPTGASRGSDGKCVCGANYVFGGNNADGTLARCYPKCPANQYPELKSDGTATGQCLSCPSFATSVAGSVECTCLAGYYPASTNPAGTLSCYPVCPPNFFPKLNSDSSPEGSCSFCPPRSTSSGTDKSCTCDPLITTGPTTNAPGQVTNCGDCPTGYVESVDQTSCRLPPSPGSKQRVKRRAETVFSLCPAGMDACSFRNSRNGGYECLSLQDELEHCGSCNNSCLDIPGVEGVTCSAGKCQVYSCRDGYNFVDLFSGSCVARTEKKTQKPKKRTRKLKLKSV